MKGKFTFSVVVPDFTESKVNGEVGGNITDGGTFVVGPGQLENFRGTFFVGKVMDFDDVF